MLARAAAASPAHQHLATFYRVRLLPRAAARCLEIAAATGASAIAA
jgi:hypothetical protein